MSFRNSIKIIILLYLMFNCNNILFTKEIILNDNSTELLLYKNSIGANELYKNNIELDFVIQNKGKQLSYYLVGINPILDSLEIKFNHEIFYNGDKVSSENKRIKSYNSVEYLKFPRDSILNLKVQIKTQQEQLNYRLLLVSQNQFLKIINRDSLLFGFFIGMFSMFLLLLISMYLFSSNVFFLKYVQLNIITIAIYFYFSGIGYQYIWGKLNWVQSVLPTILFVFYTLVHASFVKGFFNVKIEFPKLNILLNAYKFILFAFVVYTIIRLAFFFSDYRYFNWFLNIIYLMFVIYVGLSFYIAFYTYYKTRRRESLWVIIGMIIQAFGWLVFFNTLYLSIPAFNAISRFQFFESYLFISQFNFSMYVLEFILITFFIVINYKKIIMLNDVSYNRLVFLQQRNLKDYLKNIENTRLSINNYLEKNILKEIKSIKSQFEEFIFFKEISKLNTLIIKDFDNVENDLTRIMNDNNIKGLVGITLVDLIEHIFAQTVWNIKHKISYSDDVQNLQCNEIFNNHIYRIFQELMNNAIKHGAANEIDIQLLIENKKLIIVFKDNGISANNSDSKGLGILNIENRLKEFNGTMEISKDNNWKVTMYILLKNII